MDEPLRDNQALWDAWTKIHVPSAFYDVASFRDGTRPIRLVDYELQEVGPVEGRTLLHLQCHFGLDTLSWARLGATVTGLDFSAEAIAAARALAEDVGIDARFVQSNVYDAPAVLGEQFDIVYTSRGVLGWLPDIRAWARVAAGFVRPGGTFYVTEIHPVALVFADEGVEPGELRLGYPYWSHAAPISFEPKGSYADPTAPTDGLREHGWDHSLGEILTALIDAGLEIEFVHEFPFVEWPVPFLVAGDDGRSRLPADAHGELPLFFSIRATKPQDDPVRRHAAAELHDDAGQSLVAAYRFLEAARARSTTPVGEVPADLDAARDQVLLAMRQLRAAMHTLAPTALGADGLAVAVRDWAERQRLAGVVLEVTGDLPRATPSIERAAFDLLTEAVRVWRRADPGAGIEVDLRAVGERRIMRVAYDDPAQAPQDSQDADAIQAIAWIRTAANRVGGTADVVRDPAGRPRLEIELPAGPPAADSNHERGDR